MSAVSFRHALRALLKTPFVSIVAVLSLSLGIGANAAMFSVFYHAIVRPLPVPEPERLVNLSSPGPKPGSHANNRAGTVDVLFSYPMFRDLEDAARDRVSLAAHRAFGANFAYRGHTIGGLGMMVSGSYFSVLQLQPALGRLIDAGDDRVWGEAPVVVLSHLYWRTRFDSANVLNQALIVNGQPMTIVGVAPAGFEATTLGFVPQVFVPITMRGRLEQFDAYENRRSYWTYVFGRLTPGTSIDQARTALNAPHRNILETVEVPQLTGQSDQTMARFRAREINLEDGRKGQSAARDFVRPSGVLLLWVAATVLLIACVNIANLLLARSATRVTEMAVRLSVGCSRTQLVLQLLAESYWLAAIGAVGGYVVAQWTIVLILYLVPPEAFPFVPVDIDSNVLLITGVLALVTGVAFGLVPALQSTRPDLIASLRAQAGQASGSRRAARFRVALATTQIALSMGLLVSAGLFTRSLYNISRVDLGLDVENVVTFRLAPGMNGYTPQRAVAFFQGVEAALTAIPSVTGVTASRLPLIAGSMSGRDVRVQGFVVGLDTDRSSRYNTIGTDYFRTLGIPLLRGREFQTSDALGTPKVAIVNEAFVRKFQLERGALGVRIASDGGDALDTEIVGVVGDTRFAGVKNEKPPQFYLPYRQDDLITMVTFYARTALHPAPLVQAVPGLIAKLDPNLPVQELKTLPQQVSDSVFIDRGVSVLAALFAGLATALAGIGLYGVLAYAVAQRTKEIGVRMALGADRRHVRGMILSQVGVMTLAGGGIGLVAAIGLARMARSLLFELEPHDPATLAIAAILLSAVALGAGLLPAQRASKVDPIKALRFD
jgi:predicted permease